MSTVIEIGFQPTRLDHIFVYGEVEIRKVTKTFSAHYHLWSDGKFHLGKQAAITWEQDHVAYFGYPHPTEAFQKTARELILPLVQKWASENKEALEIAEKEYIAKLIKQTQEELAEKQEEIDNLQKYIDSLLTTP